jgi:hypothetical protein
VWLVGFIARRSDTTTGSRSRWYRW